MGWRPLLLIIGGLAAAAGFGQEPGPAGDGGPPAAATPAPGPADQLVIESTGPAAGDEDAVRVDLKRKTLVQGGGVRAVRGAVSLTCDSLVAYLDTEEVYAEGQVILTDGGLRLTADRIYYDFRNDRGVMANARIVRGLARPGTMVEWVVHADRLVRNGRDTFTADKAWVSTCGYAVPHYRFSMSRVVINPGRLITARNMVLYLGNVPVFYYPWFRHDLAHDWLPQDYRLGNSSVLGDFLKTSWELFQNDHMQLLARLDFTALRGNGLGADIAYRDRQELEGLLQYYVINDAAEGGLRRERLVWDHFQHIAGAGLTMAAQVYSYSDRDFGGLFFRSEYRQQRESAPFGAVHQAFGLGEATLVYSGPFDDFQDNVRYYAPGAAAAIGPLEVFPHTYLAFSTFLARSGLARDEMLALDDITRDRFQAALGLTVKTDLGPLVCDLTAGGALAWYDAYLTPTDTPNRAQPFAEARLATLIAAVFPFDAPVPGIRGLRHTIEPSLRFHRGFDPGIPNAAVDQIDSYDDLRADRYIEPALRSLLAGSTEEGWRELAVIEGRFRYYDDPGLAAVNNGGEQWGDIAFSLSLNPLADLGLRGGGTLDAGDQRFEELYAGLRWKWGRNLALQVQDFRGPGNRSVLGGMEFAADVKWSLGASARYDTRAGEYDEWRIFVNRVFHEWEAVFTASYDRERNDKALGFTLRMIRSEEPDIALREGAVIAPDAEADLLFLDR